MILIGLNEHSIGVLERAGLDAVDPDHEGLAVAEKCFAGRGRRTDEISDREAACLDHLVAQPSHAPRLFDAIGFGKTEILVNVGAYVVGIEVYRVQPRRKLPGQRGLAGAGQPHDQNFLMHSGRIPNVHSP